MVLKTKPVDAADYLQRPEDVALYLAEVFKDGDQQLIVEAIGDVARSRGMTEIARQTGLGRESPGSPAIG